jgi:membrane-associated phospholipid phosphatase
MRWPTGAAAWLAAAAFAAFASAVLVAGAHWVCPDGVCGVPWFDRAALRALDGLRGSLLDIAFGTLTWFGSLFVLVPAALLVAGRQRAAGQSVRASVFVPLALVGAALGSRLAKLAVGRPRPDEFALLGAMPGDASYPSAHVMQAVAFVLAWLLRPGAAPRVREAVAAAVLVAIVAVSRMYLQVHFPSDVLAGGAAAVLWVLALRCLPVWGRPVR